MEVGKQYTFLMFYLAMANKAYVFMWQNLLVFHDVLVRLNGFHLKYRFIVALGKKKHEMQWFEEIFVRSEVSVSGSIEKVMASKHYNSPVCSQACLEALDG